MVERTLWKITALRNTGKSKTVLLFLQYQAGARHNPHMQFQLDDVALFTRIAELGTLSAAARERNIPVSQVTRALKRLEQACGVRLLHRSTHGLSLTDEGDTMLDYGRRMRDTTAELAGALHTKQNGPSGWVRISVSPLLAHCVIAPSLAGLYQRWPHLRIDISTDDRMVDMARDGIDIAFRTGHPGPDTLVARQIGEHGRTLYASPAYLATHGMPDHPDDLQHHHLIGSSATPTMNRWALGEAEGGSELRIEGHTRTDDSALLMGLVVHGVGIARLNDLMAHALVKTGALVPLLQDHFQCPRIPIYAAMLQERHRLPKIQACMTYWSDWLRGLG